MLALNPRLRPALLLVLAGAPYTMAQSGNGRFPLLREEITVTLQKAGLTVAAPQIELPPSITASRQSPALHVTAAEMLPDSRLRVRLACVQASECQPFLATVTLPEKANALENISALRSSFSPTLPIRTVESPGLRAGQRATLLMEDEHMRIALPIVSIDSGSVGSEVRVSSLDRKQSFRGTVLDAQTVRGSLR